MRSQIFFPVLMAVMLGCGLGSHFSPPVGGFIFYHTFELFIVGVVALVVFIITLVLNKKWNHVVTILFSTFLFFIFLIFGIYHAMHARDAILAQHVGETVTVTGVVVSDPEISGDRQRFTFRASRLITDGTSTKISDAISVSLPQYPGVSYGDRLQLSEQLRQPEPFATEYGRTFQYDQYLRSQGIGYVMFADKAELSDSDQASSLIYRLFVFKHALFASLARYMHAPYESIARAMVFGDKSGIPDDLTTAFQKTGLIHIMVLSGYNITIIAVALMALFRMLGRKFGIIASFAGIIIFLLMTGLTPTSLRAGIMGGIGLLALGTYRRSNPLRALFLAGAVMVIINPFLILESVSFQLSFIATLGLITLSPLFSFVRIPQLFGLREIIASTIATQVAVLPILLGKIGMVSGLGLFTNLIVVPCVPIIMAGTAATSVVGLFSAWFGNAFGICVEYVVRALVWLVRLVEPLGVISFNRIDPLPSFFVGIFVSGIVVGVCLLVHKRRLALD